MPDLSYAARGDDFAREAGAGTEDVFEEGDGAEAAWTRTALTEVGGEDGTGAVPLDTRGVG